MKIILTRAILIAITLTLNSFSFFTVNAQEKTNTVLDDATISKILSSPSQKDLYTWLSYFTSDELGGRMTGSKEYDVASQYAANLFQEWGLKPVGDNGTYFQSFPHPYTSIKEGGGVTIYLPVGEDWIAKTLDFPDNYVPGGDSDAGDLKDKDLVYVGFGITAPDMGYDDYEGIDVKGKIVVCDGGSPYTGNDIEMQKKWLDYRYLTHKLKNAKAHGALGMLFVSITASVSAEHVDGFVYANISEAVATDLFSGTGKNRKEIRNEIRKSQKPESFALGKKADLKAVTEYHPNAKTRNVVGLIEGSDPTLSTEVIIAGAHLDHIGRMPVTMPGALDNGSGSVIMMSAAKALGTSGFKPKRSILFILYSGEETGLNGSKYFINHPLVPKDKIKVVFNIDMLGTGYGLMAHSVPRFSSLLNRVEKANKSYIHRPFDRRLGTDDELTILYTDGDAFTKFMNVPVVTLLSFGAKTRTPYHHPGDTIDLINFDIMQDATKLLLMSLLDMAQDKDLKAEPATKTKK